MLKKQSLILSDQSQKNNYSTHEISGKAQYIFETIIQL